MPLIKISSNEKVFQNLKKLLVDLKGSPNFTIRKKATTNERNQTVILPNIYFEGQKKELQDREKKEIERSINQFKTLKEINDTLLKVPGT